MKTYLVKKEEAIKKWYLIDANEKVLGRVASTVAMLLRGKHKPDYTPSVDMGDNVIVINAAKAKLTGNKPSNKKYYRHSGYPGGLKEKTYSEIIKSKPTFAMRNAIRGMLPHNRLGRKQLLHVKIYADENHPHHAQKPVEYEIT